MSSPADFLLGGGGKSAKFGEVGDSITGTIASPPEVRQQTDLKDGKPLTWDNGDPRMQLVVALKTNQRDPFDPDDDGVRNVYVKGSKKPESKSLHAAVAAAVRSAGAKSLEVGGTLTVTFASEAPPSRPGFDPAKQYEATYQAPSNAGFLGTEQPAAAPAAAPAQPAGNVDMAKQLIAAGLDDALVSQSAQMPIETVAALRAAA